MSIVFCSGVRGGVGWGGAMRNSSAGEFVGESSTINDCLH